MTVANNYAPVVTAANGSSTVFTGTWNAILAAYLVVELLNTTTGISTPVTQGAGASQYQVTTLTSSGFSITFNTAPAAGNNVVMSRSTPPSQNIPYTTARGFQGSVEEGSFDLLTNMVQELIDNFSRAISFPLGDSTSPVVAPIAQRAGLFPHFNSAGGLEYIGGTAGTPAGGSNSINYNLVTAPSREYFVGDWGNDIERLALTTIGSNNTDAADTMDNTIPAGWWCYISNRQGANIVNVTGSSFFEPQGIGSPNVSLSSLVVDPGERVKLYCVQPGTFEVLHRVKFYRKKLAGNITLYVASTGNDSNNGFSVNQPFLTIQKAIDTVANSIDLAGKTVTIQVADGTYTAGASVSGPWTGNGTVQLMGNTTTAANCVISVTSNSCLSMTNGSKLSIAGFKMTAATAGNLIQVFGNGCELTINGNMEYGAAASGWNHMLSQYGARINLFSSYKISGGTGSHFNASDHGQITQTGFPTVTVTGTPAFGSSFANTGLLGLLDVGNISFSGSATGQRYFANLNAVINSNAGGANYFPGNSAGGTATGGLYA